MTESTSDNLINMIIKTKIIVQNNARIPNLLAKEMISVKKKKNSVSDFLNQQQIFLSCLCSALFKGFVDIQ